ncbi:MAG TPA: rod shape-determining protein RodA, partial [Caldithrix sp.]|nr:rod shape-determining protein RodA [Caldithrix sp.]
TQESGTNYFSRQVFWAVLGISILAGTYFVPYRWISASAYPLYVLHLILLVLVIFVGHKGLGAERWLRFGPLVLQPSESAKLATILAVAKFISAEKTDLNRVKDFLIAAALIFFPFVLVVRQPDLGTAMVFAAIALPMFYWTGLKGGNFFLITMPFLIMFASFQFYVFMFLMIILVLYLLYSHRSRWIIVFNFLGNILMGIFTPYIWNHLKPYQQNRIKIFLNPESDPRGAGYQILQSKVAIGSGGFSGKGFMQGSQTQLRFLPEQHTDFIYAVIGEEFGFVGVMVGLSLFLVLLLRGIHLASIVKSRFSSVVTIGIVTLIGFHVLVNVGMTIGLFPVTGLPLPFLSYGGSALLTNMTMIGILLNFYKNRYEY